MFTYHMFSVSDQLAALIFPGLPHPVPTVPGRGEGAALLDLHLVTFKPSHAGMKAGMKQKRLLHKLNSILLIILTYFTLIRNYVCASHYRAPAVCQILCAL